MVGVCIAIEAVILHLFSAVILYLFSGYLVNNVVLIPLTTFLLAFLRPINWKYAVVYVAVLHVIVSLPEGFTLAVYDIGIIYYIRVATLVALSLTVNATICGLISYLRLRRLKRDTACDVTMKKIAAVSAQKESPVLAYRGGIVLAIGIIGLVCFPFLGIICGLIAWVMADYNLKRMDDGMMDPSGRGLTKASKICGKAAIIAQFLSFFIFAYYEGWF